ncbi:MAG: hypothetical protein QM785_12675 [Pyrinomonadaceae bacterium]
MNKYHRSIKTLLLIAIAIFPLALFGQETSENEKPQAESKAKSKATETKQPRKEFSEIIADNSYLVENAVNIAPGNLHTITGCTQFRSPSRSLVCGMTQETTFSGGKNLFSYSLPYSSFDSGSVRGVGDVAFTFRRQLTGDENWAVVSPRFTAFVPSGKHSKGLGVASPAFQFAVPVTKRLSDYFLGSFNSGVTYVPRALGEDESGNSVRRGLTSFNLGGSLVWRAHRNFNPLVEYVENFGNEIGEGGRTVRFNEHIVSPGVGLAWHVGGMRVSPGFAVPVSFRGGEYRTGIFFYLAFEHGLRRHKRPRIAQGGAEPGR